MRSVSRVLLVRPLGMCIRCGTSAKNARFAFSSIVRFRFGGGETECCAGSLGMTCYLEEETRVCRLYTCEEKTLQFRLTTILIASYNVRTLPEYHPSSVNNYPFPWLDFAVEIINEVHVFQQ